MYYNAHPAWRDIYLQAKEAYGDEIILLGIYHHKSDFLNEALWALYENALAKEIPPKDEELVKNIINPHKDMGNISDLKKMPLTLTLPDMVTPTMEISYYDYCFFISFWKVLYDNRGYFKNGELYEEVRSQVSGIAESVFDQQYGLYFNANETPYINETMAYHLLRAFIGFKLETFIVDDRWAWLNLQWIRDKDWPQQETPQEWFSPMWKPLKRKAPFMNWDESPL